MGRTRKDARKCTPFVVHDGKALTRELLALCPSLQRDYDLPKWCTDTHAQTLIGSQILVDDDGMLLQVCKTNHRGNIICKSRKNDVDFNAAVKGKEMYQKCKPL